MGTTINGLPAPAAGVDPRYEPATGWCDAGGTTALEPTTITLTVAAVAMPTKEAAATKIFVEVAASAEGRCNPAPSFTAVAPPWQALRRWAVARDDYSIRTVPGKSLSVVSVAEWPNDTVSYRHKTAGLKTVSAPVASRTRGTALSLGQVLLSGYRPRGWANE